MTNGKWEKVLHEYCYSYIEWDFYTKTRSNPIQTKELSFLRVLTGF